MQAESSYDFGRESGADRRFKCSNQQEYTMRKISPMHNITREVPSSMYSMCRRDCCLSIWGIISSATSSWGMASGGKLDLSTHCRYSFPFLLLWKYFNNVVSYGSIVQAFYSPYSNSNEHPSQYCVSATSQALRIRQLEKAWHLTYFRLWHYRYPISKA